jgi:hypothetical protein
MASEQDQRPVPSPEDEARFTEILIAAATCGYDFPGWLARHLATAAARLGSTEALLASRPGSWEASDLRQLLGGTVGHDDEYLGTYREGGNGG